jgi:hypothetical protein
MFGKQFYGFLIVGLLFCACDTAIIDERSAEDLLPSFSEWETMNNLAWQSWLESKGILTDTEKENLYIYIWEDINYNQLNDDGKAFWNQQLVDWRKIPWHSWSAWSAPIEWTEQPAPTVNLKYDYKTGIAEINVTGGTPGDFWISQAAYGNTGVEANKKYKYIFEAWTESGDREIDIQYYQDDNEGEDVTLFFSRQILTTIHQRFELIGETLPISEHDSVELEMSFYCGNKNGIFYVKLISVTEITEINEGNTIIYNGNGNTSGTPPIDSGIYDYGTYISILDRGTLERGGYIFRGWSKVANPSSDDDIFQAGETICITDSQITFYAIWDEAFGYLIVNISNGSARTLVPSPSVEKYSILFTPMSNQPNHDQVDIFSDNSPPIQLSPGNWKLQVFAYYKDSTNNVPFGTGEAIFTIRHTEVTSVSVSLNTKPGTFSYNISFPSNVINSRIEIRSISSDDEENIYSIQPIPNSIIGYVDLSPGYYLVKILLNTESGDTIRTDVLYIYSGLQTTFEFIFKEEDFIR